MGQQDNPKTWGKSSRRGYVSARMAPAREVQEGKAKFYRGKTTRGEGPIRQFLSLGIKRLLQRKQLDPPIKSQTPTRYEERLSPPRGARFALL